VSGIRSTSSGKRSSCAAFVRASASPRAALVLGSEAELPTGWPTTSGVDAGDAQLGHVPGWTCEVRRDAILVLNPLGEGVFRAALPALSDDWLSEVRATASAALYLLDRPLGDDPAQVALEEAAVAGPVPAASVRTAVDDAYGTPDAVGRNEPCPCGSGRKYKHCHGR
jgi:hypothetical protein